MAAYTVPTFEEIRNRYLRAIVNRWPDAAVGPDSDHYVRATGIASVVEEIYAHQAWIYRQAFPDLADADIMEKMANQRGLVKKSATVASGMVRLGGAAATPIAAGQQVFTAQGVYVATTAAAVVGVGGTVDVAAAAVVAGAAGNLTGGTPATVNAPPAGIVAGATVLSMTGGADIEGDDSLLARLLLELSEEAQGGNATDYKRWALSVAGVARAYVFDCRRGSGTVDVVPMPETGLADAPLLAAVQALLDDLRPVGMRKQTPVLALAGMPVETGVTATLALAPGYVLSDLMPTILTAIDRVFAGLGPGDTLIRQQLITAIMNVAGVTDVTLAMPAANVTSSVTSLLLEVVTRGTVAIT